MSVKVIGKPWPWRYKAVIGGLGVAGLVMLCGLPSLAGADSKPNFDPHNGQEVRLFQVNSHHDNDRAVTKQCDGTTLVYMTPESQYSGGVGIAVVPDSPECK